MYLLRKCDRNLSLKIEKAPDGTEPNKGLFVLIVIIATPGMLSNAVVDKPFTKLSDMIYYIYKRPSQPKGPLGFCIKHEIETFY